MSPIAARWSLPAAPAVTPESIMEEALPLTSFHCRSMPCFENASFSLFATSAGSAACDASGRAIRKAEAAKARRRGRTLDMKHSWKVGTDAHSRRTKKRDDGAAARLRKYRPEAIESRP